MSKAACLLIHGFGGEPFEMSPVAEALQNLGYPVSLPTLPGHGTTIEAWSRTRWSGWLKHAAEEYERLQAAHGRVFVLGLSMGGSLSLALAQRYRPAGVVTMASPVYLYRFLPPEATDWRLPMVGLLKKVRPIWPTDPKKPESRLIAPWQGYDEAVALEPLHSFVRGLRVVRRDLGRITSPLLAMHSPLDRQVPLGNLWEITSKVSSTVRRAVVLPIEERITGHHVITTHVETRDEVAKLCAGFVSDLDAAS
ncbi:alpha/beta hydrolase [Fundidesulfovibrio terrae]|uniref:alpha/beta hydrolase n=1 Tax=Fundidesulfovibrio terrae TaxID=2922866 RepID=UPI001FAFF5D4|nr:alpha/beta fold hydrolase [Fundidesulfovibrio terrae]